MRYFLVFLFGFSCLSYCNCSCEDTGWKIIQQPGYYIIAKPAEKDTVLKIGDLFFFGKKAEDITKFKGYDSTLSKEEVINALKKKGGRNNRQKNL